MMCGPASCESSFDETIRQIESKLNFALEHAKTMDKNKSVWHPNSTPGVSVSLSNETMRLVDSSLRELWRLKDRERYCDVMSEEEIARLHGEYCYNREVEFRRRKTSGYIGQMVGEHSTKCSGCPYLSEISCLLKFAMSKVERDEENARPTDVKMALNGQV